MRNARGGSTWLAVGDSAVAEVWERRCVSDVCASGQDMISDDGWSVADSSIVRLHAPESESANRHAWWNLSVHLVALRPGRTTIQVGGLYGPGDTMPSNRPVDRAVSIDVVVTLPISRVEFGGMPDTVQVSSVVEATLRVTDQAGRLIDGAPVVMRNGDASWIAGSVTAGSGRMRIHGPSGQRMLIATFGGQSDTAYVYVARRPPR